MIGYFQEIQFVNEEIEELRIKINKVSIKNIYSYPRPEKKPRKQKPKMLPTVLKKPNS